MDVPGLDRELTHEEAQALVRDNPEMAIFVLLTLSSAVAEQRKAAAAQDPSAPPSATPPFKKPTTPAGRRKKTKRGAKPGHQGKRRRRPERIDRKVSHRIKHCPDCHGRVTPIQGKGASRSRVIEDIPENTKPEAVEHTTHRGYCAQCKKTVEARVADALPGSQLGHRVLVLAAWLRFGLGVSLSQIRQVLGAHLQFPISDGGLVEAAHRIATILRPWHEEIGQEVRSAGTLNADETGWRVMGKTHWLWCFCATAATYYMIDRSRGSPALSKFFTEAINGILVSDFWGPYNSVEVGGRQVCFPHLFREIDSTTEKDSSTQWLAFRKKLRRLLRDALRLKTAEGLDVDAFASRRDRLDRRLADIIEAVDTSRSSTDNDNVKRIAKRLRRHKDQFFTFLDHDEVVSNNNRAEREIRPAVIMRKNSHGNQSSKGAETQAILMSVFRTLRLRKLDPLKQIVEALRQYVLTDELPPLPKSPEIG